MSHGTTLWLALLLAVVGLVVLITRFKLSAFIALALASLFMGGMAGMNPVEAAKSFGRGLGNVLGDIAMVIGLGAILGRWLADSGAAEEIAQRLWAAFGERRAPWAVALVAFVVGLPVFFAVGLVLLVPIIFSVARQSRIPVLRLGLPLVAGLSAVHSLVPPHPGPIAAVGLLHADLGKTIVYALVIGLPAALIAGPLLGVRLAQTVGQAAGLPVSGVSDSACLPLRSQRINPPGFCLALLTILLPVLLMLLATLAALTLAPGSALRRWLEFLGHPIVAMLAAVLFSLGSLGRGIGRSQLLKSSEESLAPIAQILLVVGAGGGFSLVLTQSGAGETFGKLAMQSGISPLLLGWLVAALVRVATGSATVAITTAAGILAPLVAANSGLNRELLVVATGAGSLVLSHLNDGGFWLVKEYLNLSVTQTLQTWTVIVTVISLLALVFALVLSHAL